MASIFSNLKSALMWGIIGLIPVGVALTLISGTLPISQKFSDASGQVVYLHILVTILMPAIAWIALLAVMLTCIVISRVVINLLRRLIN